MISRVNFTSILIDRATARVTIMASTEGGMDIEDVAEATPERLCELISTLQPVSNHSMLDRSRLGLALKAAK